MKRILLIVIASFLLVSLGYCQDTKEIIQQVASVYTNGGAAGNNVIAGFSLAGLMAGLLFGGIGFVAFVYGKRNAEFRPMLIGVFLMGYPYFLKNTIALYVIGLILTVLLFIWRE